MKALCRLLLVALPCLLLGSCGPPESQNPLSSPKGSPPDARLLGVWFGQLDDTPTYLHFVANDEGTTDILLVNHAPQVSDRTLSFEMHPTTLGERHYMNLAFTDPEKEEEKPQKRYLFARYEIDGEGQLTLWTMTQEPVAAAIEAKKLHGRFTRTDAGIESVEVRSPSGPLAAWVQSEDQDALFDLYGKFTKIH